MSIQMLVPFDYEDAARRDVAARALPDVLRLGIVDNGKLCAKRMLTAIGDALVGSGRVVSFSIHSKRTSTPLSRDQVEEIASSADVVIVGVGDCGGCSSVATVDALQFVELGIPTALVATYPFEYLVDSVERQRGLSGLNRLLLEHPLWTKDDAWFAQSSERLASEFVQALSAERRDEPAVLDADGAGDPFAGLRQSLAADDFTLRVGRDERRFVFEIVAGPESCADCLIPSDTFVDIVVAAGARSGLDITKDDVSVSYP